MPGTRGPRPPLTHWRERACRYRSVAGVRMALEPGRGRTAVPVRTTMLAAIVGVAAVAAALTVTASADRLVSTPACTATTGTR